MVKNIISFQAIEAQQSDKHSVYSFAATASEVFQIARIDRIGRSDQGELFGFQRPQVSRHILEIRDYLEKPDSVLPNSVVLAFVGGVEVEKNRNGISKISIDITDKIPGLIVDGQQRLTALQPLEDRNFQVFVSAIICENIEELRRQFILINNTKPLPKELIYELLPTVSSLPSRLSVRSFAANLASKLNYLESHGGKKSPFFGVIKTHTNPTGTVGGTSLQKVIMNSRSNGALRDFSKLEDVEEKSLDLIANFYGAVMDVFPEAWSGMGPRTSRLKHSVGIIAMGYAMEIAYAIYGCRSREEFASKLECLAQDNICAWTSGTWYFSTDEVRGWDRLQNTPPDIRMLSEYVVRIVKDQGIRPGSSADVEQRSLNLNKTEKETS